MASITLTMQDGRSVGFSGFKDAEIEALFNALAYYQLINDHKPLVHYNACDPKKGTFTVRDSTQSNRVLHAAATITFYVENK